MKIYSFFLLLVISSMPILSIGQINFYTTDDIDWNGVFTNPSYQSHYDSINSDSTSFKMHFFAPWNEDFASLLDTVNANDVIQECFYYQGNFDKNPCFLGNYQEFDESLVGDLTKNANANNFPNMNLYGLTVANTSIRRFPTSEICFHQPSDAGEGYPFDYFQYTTLWLNTPVRILHESLDHSWYFVISPYSYGWIEASDIGLVDLTQVNDIQILPHVCIMKDRIPVSSNLGFRTEILYVGTILPVAETDKPLHESILVPFASSQNRRVEFDTCVTQSYKSVKPFPIAFDSTNVKIILQELIGSKYGWGGIGINARDCSSTTKDFFTPFGVWLPRNSSQQVEIGKKVNLNGSAEEKVNYITENGIPLISLLYKRGHIMLYLGSILTDNGVKTPIMFHNIWGVKPYFKSRKLLKIGEEKQAYGINGIKTHENGEVSSRFVIGKAVITKIELESDIKLSVEARFDMIIDNLAYMVIHP